MKRIWLVFYTKAEDDEEMFLSAHETRASAVQGAETDAKDNDGEDWTWGDGQHHANLPKGFTRSTNILTDWSKVDDYEVGSYTLYEVPLHPPTTQEGVKAAMAALQADEDRANAKEAELRAVGDCLHGSFYWINRRNLNWRCTDTCGYQFFGKSVTQARKEARQHRRAAVAESRRNGVTESEAGV